MEIKLAGWSSEGLRCPDVKVDLTDGSEVAKVSLIQMPNGTGKTTTLNLLHATLTGNARDWLSDEVTKYKRPNDPHEEGRFIVVLLVDGEKLTFELKLNFVEGTARYITTAPGSGGATLNWSPPSLVRRFLNEDFLKLFIFDGEFADRLRDPVLSEAEKSIDALCQLYLLNDVSEYANQWWEKKSKLSGASSDAAKSKWFKRRKDLKQRRDAVKGLRAETLKKRNKVDARIQKLKGVIDKHLSENEKTKIDYQIALSNVERFIGEANVFAIELMQLIRLPFALSRSFCVELESLKDNLDKLKLPENTSSQFFSELVNETRCVCDRDMNDPARKAIMERASRYLGSEEAGVVNALKSDIEQFLGPAEDELPYDRLDRARSALLEARVNRDLAEQEVARLRGLLIEAGDEQLEQWQNELERLQDDVEKLNNLLKAIDGPGSEDEENIEKLFSLKLIEKWIREAEDKFAEITNTLDIKNQYQFIQKITSEARKIARENIKENLLKETNERLLKVLAQDPIQLSGIGSSLELDQDGASVGQTLSIGYTFLMSALNRGTNDFPLVVDSPAGSLDDGRRREVGKLIPSMCSQFVAFTISTEREHFVDALEESTNDIKYVTLFRKTPGTKEMEKKLPSSGVTSTRNGIVVSDRGYFHDFKMLEEME
jgi:DNA sulfur modification protein DndD